MSHKWKRQPQETNGTYHFAGRFVATRMVTENLSKAEIILIYWEIRYWVEQSDGLDYLQVFIHEDSGQKLFLIDQINDEMKASGGHPKEHDYCTLLFAEEY